MYILKIDNYHEIADTICPQTQTANLEEITVALTIVNASNKC